MKIKEKAVQDLQRALELVEVEGFSSNEQRNFLLAGKMQGAGWNTVKMGNLPQVAQMLGFTVIGETIYGLDE